MSQKNSQNNEKFLNSKFLKVTFSLLFWHDSIHGSTNSVLDEYCHQNFEVMVDNYSWKLYDKEDRTSTIKSRKEKDIVMDQVLSIVHVRSEIKNL